MSSQLFQLWLKDKEKIGAVR